MRGTQAGGDLAGLGDGREPRGHPRGLMMLPGGTPVSLCWLPYSAASASRPGPVGPQVMRRCPSRAARAADCQGPSSVIGPSTANTPRSRSATIRKNGAGVSSADTLRVYPPAGRTARFGWSIRQIRWATSVCYSCTNPPRSSISRRRCPGCLVCRNAPSALCEGMRLLKVAQRHGLSVAVRDCILVRLGMISRGIWKGPLGNATGQ